MIFIKELKRNAMGEGYPFIGVVKNNDPITFDAPVTIITGDNGSGKSTLANLVAAKTGCFYNDFAQRHEECLYAFTVIKSFSPSTKVYFSAEKFIEYVKQLEEMKNESNAALEEIRNDERRSSFGKMMASMPHASTLYEINNLYNRNLFLSSHGEGFISFFDSRIRDNGLYILDEPEAALSFENQYRLAYRIFLEAKDHGSQFIIATHSPVITAIPKACIYQIENDRLVPKTYEELANVEFLKMFLDRHDRMFE
jgi:predicted ATPase